MSKHRENESLLSKGMSKHISSVSMLGKGVSQLWSEKPKMRKAGSHIGAREAPRSHRGVMHSHLIDS